MTPTREQAFNQWFSERYPDTTSVYSEFKGTTVRDLMREAHAAGREQGLREAVAALQALRAKVASPIFGQERHDIGHAVIDNCAAAIEQLRAK